MNKRLVFQELQPPAEIAEASTRRLHPICRSQITEFSVRRLHPICIFQITDSFVRRLHQLRTYWKKCITVGVKGLVLIIVHSRQICAATSIISAFARPTKFLHGAWSARAQVIS